jgi:hypothetical protein
MKLMYFSRFLLEFLVNLGFVGNLWDFRNSKGR